MSVSEKAKEKLDEASKEIKEAIDMLSWKWRNLPKRSKKNLRAPETRCVNPLKSFQRR